MLVTAASTGVLLGLTACESPSKLASDIEGTWSGAPETLIDNTASSATITETYTFMRDETTNGGIVVRSGLVSVTGQVNGTGAFLEPFSMTAGATAMISGSWEATSDDEICFTWNDSSLVVKVDPQALTLSTNILSGEDAATVDSMKPQLAESLRARIAQAVEIRFIGTRKFDDVKIKKSILEYEVNDIDYQMARQGPAE